MPLAKDMKIGKEGRALIKEFEGLKLYVYDDGLGIPTIGYGHTGSEVYFGMPDITLKKANEWLDEDVLTHAVFMNEVVTTDLNQNQYDALISFLFNLGAYIIDDTSGSKNKKLYQMLNDREFDDFCDEMMKYTNPNDPQVHEGLLRRRKAEVKLFKKKSSGGGSGGSTPKPTNESKPPKSQNGQVGNVGSGANDASSGVGGGGSTGGVIESGGTNLKSGLIYLKNESIYQIGGKRLMNRFNNFAIINGDVISVENPTPPKENVKPVENGKTTDSKPKPENKPKDNDNKVNLFVKELESIPLHSLYYDNKRPQPNPNVCGFADCSGYIGFCLRKLLPEVWRNGACNTGTQLAWFDSKGRVVKRSRDFNELSALVKKGDIMYAGVEPSVGSGNDSHVWAYYSNDKHMFIDVGSSPCPNKQNDSWVSGYKWTYFALVRPFG